MQRRQLLDRIDAQGGVPALDRIDELWQRLEATQHEAAQVRSELAKLAEDRKADQEHIEDLREWGEGLAEHIRGLEEIDVPSNGFSLKS
jgi:predicted nuclease with TOPRIM domain